MPPSAVCPGAIRRTIGVVGLGLLALPAGASAQAGGAYSAPAPSVTGVQCAKQCVGSYAKPGSVVRLRGTALGDVVSVTFVGTRLAGDETAPVKPRKTSPEAVVVTVPADATQGRVVVTNAEGRTSAPSPVVKISRPATPKQGTGPISTVVTGKKAFIGGERLPTLTYSLQTATSATVVVNVVRAADGSLVTSFNQGTVAPGETREVAWDGKVGGVEQPEGRYAFVVAAAAGGVTASTAQEAPTQDGFLLLDHRFPIAGKHTYVEGFGAGRGHQGADVFAKCGTPVVAARGGTVKLNKFQSRAGNYLVIDEGGDNPDSVYMHMRDPALPPKGTRVKTGEVVGYIGDTGRASGCHLHFERWTAPGWYTGGEAYDPVPELKAWDEFS